ncbi:MAG TPA: haloacid dehalogenase type II [Burkholderiaceae bacterium]|nr:haloacid dehalogenase type II [Burkholderiaceae bacterium]
MTIQAIVFDAYGTLFDVYSITALAEKLYPGHGAALSTLWRDKQIEYTKLRSMCSMYKPFWQVTQEALVYACRRLQLDLPVEAHSALMGQYARLPAFPEAAEVLRQLRSQGIKTAILSNGNPEMLAAALKAAGLEGEFNHILSVDTVKKFKVAPEAYQLAPDVFGLSAKNILFVSGNGWDVCGAAWFGYVTFWVNRAGLPFEELGVAPHGSGADLRGVLDFVHPEAA